MQIIRRSELPKTRRVNPNLEKVVVGKIVAVENHPNADTIRIATVDVGSHQYRIVFGGPRIEEIGAKVAVALPGAPTDSKKLIERRFRGIISQAMICSAVELGFLEEGPDEILILPKDIEVGSLLKSVDKSKLLK